MSWSSIMGIPGQSDEASHHVLDYSLVPSP